jgi:prepilin-type N-terminal cleavage/methylation domain-containing protein
MSAFRHLFMTRGDFLMVNKRSRLAFSLVEVMVVVLLMSIVMMAASMVFISGQQLFLDTSVKSEVQANVMQALHRISFELQNSGYDSTGAFKVAVLDNAGQGGTDILRFSIPFCVCGMSVFDSTKNARSWGAPMIWGQDGCDTTAYVVGGNGKVDICHFPPLVPNTSATLGVYVNQIQGHLAHGDYIGSCGLCSPTNYNNKTIEYLVDVNGQLLRNVLDSNNAVIKMDIVARQVTSFQAVVDSAVAPVKHSTVNVTVGATKNGTRGRVAAVTNNVDVLLMNR